MKLPKERADRTQTNAHPYIRFMAGSYPCVYTSVLELAQGQ